jgi:hypothetical protein
MAMLLIGYIASSSHVIPLALPENKLVSFGHSLIGFTNRRNRFTHWNRFTIGSNSPIGISSRTGSEPAQEPAQALAVVQAVVSLA